MKSSSVLDEDQREALVSPARIEIVESLLHSGPRTVAQIGEALDRAADSLYYHLNKLVKVGLLRESLADSKEGQGEAIFEATSRSFRSVCDPADSASVDLERRGLGALLRHAERTYGRALDDPKIRTSGKRRDLEARSARAHLNAKARAELNRRLDGLFEFLRRQSDPGSGRATSVTLVSCPSVRRSTT